MNLEGNSFLIIYVSIVLFILGSVFGSFINCVSGRIVEGKNWIKGRSICENCKHELNLLDLIPIFSYIFLKGKCRYCGAKLSIRYMLTELFLGLVFVFLFLRNKTIDYVLFRDLVLVTLLLGLSLVDLDSYIIPDGFVIIGIINWLVSILYVSDKLAYLKEGLIGGLSIGLFILLLSLVMDKVLKKESLGGGDIKLLFMVCLYAGLFKGILLLIISCVIGLIFVTVLKKNKIPFGPSISMATFVVLMYGNLILNWYFGLF